MNKPRIKNLNLKLFSLILAVFLEVRLYSPDNSVSTSMEVPIEIRNLSDNMMVVGSSNNHNSRGLYARVRFRGSGPDVKQLGNYNVRFLIDLPIPNPSTYTVKLNDKQLRLPPGVDAEDIDPITLDLSLEKVVKKELLVVPVTVGQVATGYRVEELKVIPETVFARGPQSELEGLGYIETHRLDISGRETTKRFELPLIDKGPHTTLGLNVVTVEVKVAPILSDRVFSKVTVNVMAPEGYAATVEPSSVKVTVSGTQNLLDKLSEKEIHLMVDARTLSAGKVMITPEEKLPNGLRIVEMNPKKVALTLVAGAERDGTSNGASNGAKAGKGVKE